VRVRLPVDNDQGALKPGMWADVRIFAGPVDDQLIVPREAVIRTGRSERVVLRIDDERFAVRDVVTGMESGDYVAIVEGLEAGDTVVTSGQFLLDSEASQNAGEQRLGGHHDH
jgi:Cu(I)/Ag(I) efflux system membrane fusion protein